MKITLDINPTTGNGTCLVEREPGDRRYRRGGYGSLAESHLLHHVKEALNKQGYNFIKKRMWRDGHMVDENQSYLRERVARKGKRCLTIRNGSFAIYEAGERFNIDGMVSLDVENIGDSMEPAVVVAKKVVPVDPPKAPDAPTPSTEPVVTMKSVSVSMGQVPSTDPLAYAYGFTHGITGREADTEPTLKSAYHEGYAQGRRVRFGEEPIPAWARAA